MSEARKTRVRLIEKFVRIAENLYRIRNFHTHTAIINGLCHQAVCSLNQTMQDLTPRCRSDLDQQMFYVGKETGWKSYSPSEGIRLPIIDVILSDIMSLEDAQPDEVNGLINYEKCKALYESVGLVQCIQQRNYNLQPVVQITKIITKLPEIMSLDEMLEAGNKVESRKQTAVNITQALP